MTPLVLTLIGDDKPGLVNAASEAVAEHGGTWLESRLARLSGKFANALGLDQSRMNIGITYIEAAGYRIVAQSLSQPTLVFRR